MRYPCSVMPRISSIGHNFAWRENPECRFTLLQRHLSVMGSDMHTCRVGCISHALVHEEQGFVGIPTSVNALKSVTKANHDTPILNIGSTDRAGRSRNT